MTKENAKKFFFRKLVLGFTLVVISFGVACSTSKGIDDGNTSTSTIAVKTDERKSLLDGRVSFVPPTDFESITKEQMKRKLAENTNPLLLLTNDEQTGDVTVSYDTGFDYKSDQLAEIKEFNEGTFRASKTKWIKSQIIEMNGRQWNHFEWVEDKSELPDLVAPVSENENSTPEVKEETPIHYNEYSTIFNGGLLNFSYTSQVKDYAQLKNVFEKSLNSIQIKE